MSKGKARRRKSVKGSLFLIALMLIGSALMRIGEGAGQAWALDAAAKDTQADSAKGTKATVSAPAELQAMLEAFQRREQQIAKKEAAIEDRMHALRIADAEITRKMSALQEAEEQLRDTIALAETAAEDDLDRLTRVYETMKPKQAAALFEEMDPNFAAGFLGRMRPDAAAAIMAGLSPEAANLYSVVLAGRNANVPRE